MATMKRQKPKKATTAQIERVAEVLWDLFDQASIHGHLKPKDARELAERLVEALK